MSRQMMAVLGVVLAVCLVDCASQKVTSACNSASDCAGGAVCIDGRCVPVCNMDSDCLKTERCDLGTCVAVSSPTCTADAECVSPAQCRVALAAVCVGGACSYECRAPCATLEDCPTGEYCTGAHGCAPTLPDGEACSGTGDASCTSGHCDNGRCCQAGNCCGVAGDCPPTFTRASACANTTTTTDCQGSRWDATCDNHVCGTVETADDSGCSGVSHDCAAYAAVACTADPVQTAPACAISCGGSSECASGHGCIGFTCQTIVGLGAACTGGGQGTCNTGLKCENAVCCVATDPTCCTSSPQCGGGLACNTGTFACYSSCNDFDASRCADPATHYCLSNVCVPKVADGERCTNSGGCQNGHCVDGVCCGNGCTSLCQACVGALTGGADGTCANIQQGGYDSEPTPQCTATGAGCGAASCACNGSGGCVANDNVPCTSHAQCASDVCECFNASCSDRRCRSAACGQCQIAVSGGGCVSGLGAPAPVDDPDAADACAGSLSCFAGSCRKDNGQSCGSNAECGNVCIGGLCADRSAVGSACDMSDGSADCQPGLVCATGTCRIPSGSGCSNPGDCEMGFCAGGVCCTSACTGPCAVCRVSGNGTCTMPADDAACGTVSCSSLDSSTQCRSYTDITSNRCAAIGSCKVANTTYCTTYADDNARCGTCQKCVGGSCTYELASEDLKSECSTVCGTGNCNGSGACAPVASGTSCADSCKGGTTCDGGYGSASCTGGCTCSGHCIGASWSTNCIVCGSMRYHCTYAAGSCNSNPVNDGCTNSGQCP